MLILDLGVGAIFFAVGLILALSKSAKGSAVVTCLLGLAGGGGVVFGGGHVAAPGQNGSALDAASLGWLLLAIGVGTVLGLVVGIVWKLGAKKKGQDIGINLLQPDIDKNKKL